jgi:hypothetical protein
MSKPDPYELEVLKAYGSGKLKSIASKADPQRMRAAARATAVKDKRVNIRLSSADLLNIQAKPRHWVRACRTRPSSPAFCTNMQQAGSQKRNQRPLARGRVQFFAQPDGQRRATLS